MANLPPGVDDNTRGEAALRMAYASTGLDRGIWAERILAGQFKIKPEEMGEAYNLAATAAHNRGDLRRSIELYQQSPILTGDPKGRSAVLKELAGLYIEMGKGEGKEPIAVEARSEMFDQARQTCAEVMADKNAPEPHRMVAGLMNAETWFFQGDYFESYQQAKTFLDSWTSDTARRQNRNERIYINTAKTLQAQNCYFLGLDDEAEALANDLASNPPPPGDEFKNSDGVFIGLEVLKLCAHNRGDTAGVADYGLRAWHKNPDWSGTERTLLKRRKAWQDHVAQTTVQSSAQPAASGVVR